jgi:hypothetical protein
VLDGLEIIGYRIYLLLRLWTSHFGEFVTFSAVMITGKLERDIKRMKSGVRVLIDKSYLFLT